MPHIRHLFVTLLTACTVGGDAPSDTDTERALAPTCVEVGSPYTHDDTLSIADIQALGTHNSYHLRPPNPLVPEYNYDHAPLDEQLALGVRAVELDLHRRVDGSFSVAHLPHIDPGTTCDAFSECLGVMLTWSLANPCHAPLMVWLEPKDLDVDATFPDEHQTYVGQESAIDDELRAVWPPEKLFEPDELRGSHATLPEAVTQDGWPTLGAMRGQALFAMLDSDEHRAAYVTETPNLAGRAMFVDSDSASDPFAATFKIDNAVGDAAKVTDLVGQGFVVTSNVGGAGADPTANDAEFAATLAAGANYLATDAPGVVGDTTKDFIPGGAPARCNLVRDEAGCVATDIEALPAP
jgi:hypothetical protein